jgi:hypothetical protein
VKELLIVLVYLPFWATVVSAVYPATVVYFVRVEAQYAEQDNAYEILKFQEVISRIEAEE